MNCSDFFSSLWRDYVAIAPQVQDIASLFAHRGDTVVNDHVAFRTVSDSPIAQSRLERVLASLGYQPYDSFRFEQKKLNAKAYQNLNEPAAPKIFLSELQLSEVPVHIARILSKFIQQIPTNLELEPSLFWRGPLWQAPTLEEYKVLSEFSEYAAWLITMGLRVNHFTVSVNQLKSCVSLTDVNALLLAEGFQLNSVGGLIKGSPQLMLEQSSTLADRKLFHFSSGEQQAIPTCFYEFALRYPMADGKLYNSFIEGNADKIFESTNLK